MVFKKSEWPTNLIDHKDGNGKNNAFINLRIGNSSKNQWNTDITSKNKSGQKGVHLEHFFSKKSDKKRSVWVAKIRVNNKIIHLGYFKNFEDAKNARIKADIKYHREWSFSSR